MADGRWPMKRGSMRFVTSFVLLLQLSQPPSLRDRIRSYVDTQQNEIVAELTQLLAIPNIASDKANIRRNAEHLQRLLTKHRFAAEILETSGNPLVFAELAGPQNPSLPTVLFYCHYDGQPVDAKKWNQADPFEPVIRGEGREARIYARSASDDKSPIIALVTALDALQASGSEPVRTTNVKIILDGEEEASSPSLVPAIARYRDKLRADLMVILDGPGHSSGRPTIAYGVEYDGSRITQGITQKEGMEQPLYYWDPVIAPSGMTFYTGDLFPGWKSSAA